MAAWRTKRNVETVAGGDPSGTVVFASCSLWLIYMIAELSGLSVYEAD
jgi:hypothetical protein